jgi:hypothetical protein
VPNAKWPKSSSTHYPEANLQMTNRVLGHKSYSAIERVLPINVPLARPPARLIFSVVTLTAYYRLCRSFLRAWGEPFRALAEA